MVINTSIHTYIHTHIHTHTHTHTGLPLSPEEGSASHHSHSPSNSIEHERGLSGIDGVSAVTVGRDDWRLHNVSVLSYENTKDISTMLLNLLKINDHIKVSLYKYLHT